MPKPPCACDPFSYECDANHCARAPQGVAYDATMCRVCWLYHNDPAAKAGWDAPKQEPGTAKKIGHFLKAVGEHALAGMKTTSKEESDERMSICLACPFMPDKVARKCLECGCYMEVKVTWNEQKCPIGKW